MVSPTNDGGVEFRMIDYINVRYRSVDKEQTTTQVIKESIATSV